VGDVHGCLEELLALMAALGYRAERQGSDFVVTPPTGRTLAFVGDLVDRGPACPQVLRLAIGMARAGQAFCVPGNRDVEFVKALKGRAVKVTHGMARALQQLEAEPEEFRAQVIRFLDWLPGHYVFDEGRLVIAHAGLKEPLHGRSSAAARAFALRGEITGKRDAFGLPVRADWAAHYRGKALVVFGHTPVAEPLWVNNTVNIDTGCVYGGHLTALRYPERETVSVPARAIHYKARKPFPVNAALGKAAK
jgi:protein phosphatase